MLRGVPFRGLGGQAPPWGRYRRPLFAKRLGDASSSDLLNTQVDLFTALPWLLVAGVVIYGISAVQHRPKKAKRRRQPKPLIVVGRGVGSLAGLGLLGLGALGAYAVGQARSGQ